jgi:hypothetical protein
MEMVGIAKNEQKTASVWVGWVCIPLLLLFNFQFYSFDNYSFDLRLLHIPAVVALTYRYGKHGFVAALIGSAPLLIYIDSGFSSFGGQISLYLIVVHVGWLTLSKGWFDPQKSAVPRVAFMIVLLLGCSVSIELDPFFLESFEFYWDGPALLFYAFFVLGSRGVQIDRWLAVAGLLTFIGIVLMLADIYGNNFRWTLNTPGDFLTLLMFFWTGKWIRDAAIAAAPSAQRLSTGFKLAMGAGILYLLDPMWQGSVAVVSNSTISADTLYAISPAGSYYVLPLLAMLLSITRRNGMLIAIILVGTYYMLHGFAAVRNADIFFSISFTSFAVAITFAMLGTRIARQIHGMDSAAVASLLPASSARKQSTLKPEDWERQHDEISNTVRRVMFSVLAYSLFCGLTLASTSDASLFGAGSKIELPIAGTSINYSTFLTVGPLVLIGLIVYLHLFLQSSVDLGRPQGANPLPYLFNMKNPLALILSGFLHYWLPVLLLFQFAWKAIPQPMAGFWLGLASIGIGIAMAYLHMARMRTEAEGIPRQLTRVMFFAFSLLLAIQMASGGAMLKRSLMLNKAEFEGLDLRDVDFREASLEKANLKGVNLTGANLFRANLVGAEFTNAQLTNVNFREASLQGVNLSDLDLTKSDLRGANITDTKFGKANLDKADLRGVRWTYTTNTQSADANLDTAVLQNERKIANCKQFAEVENLDKAHRDDDLACGKAIPKPPQDDKELRKHKYK